MDDGFAFPLGLIAFSAVVGIFALYGKLSVNKSKQWVHCMNIIILLMFIALIILGIALANRVKALAVALIFAGIVGTFLCLKYSKSLENEAARNIASTYLQCSYDEFSKTLYVGNRAPEYRDFLIIRGHSTKAYNYVEPSYQYTAVSVGGVTTGGISKSGDYYKKSDYTMNYEIVYPNSSNGGVIEWIFLTNGLLPLAKKSMLKEYIENDKVRVVNEYKASNLYVQYQKMGLSDMAVSQLEQDKSAAYPTKEKCDKIINWLCGIN